MSTGTPHTSSWAEAVTVGLFGAYVDTVPPDYYTVKGPGGGGGGGGDPTITSVSPDHCPIGAVPGDITFTGTNLDNPAIALGQLRDPGGNVANTGILSAVTATSLTATFTSDTGSRNPGAGEVGLGDADQYPVTPAIPFTFDPVPRNLDSFTPTTLSIAAVAGGFDLTCVGTFGDKDYDLQLVMGQPTLGGTELRSTSVTKNSESEIVGHFGAPAGMVPGDAQVAVATFFEEYYPGSGFLTWTA